MNLYDFKTEYDCSGDIACFLLEHEGRCLAVIYPVELGGGRDGVSCMIGSREFVGESLEYIAEAIISELEERIERPQKNV